MSSAVGAVVGGALVALILLPALAVLVVNLIVALIMSAVVEKKGYTVAEVHAFAKCFFLGLAGWIYVAALPDRNLQKQNKQMIALLSRIDAQGKQAPPQQ